MKILLVEDDHNLSSFICNKLRQEGYLVDSCLDGEEGMRYALDPQLGYDMVMLDRMLPIVDGLTILKSMRAKHLSTPAILITGLDSVDNRVEGLDCGADDYLVKPFEMKELLARVRALIRRPAELKDTGILHFGDLRLDTSKRELSAGKDTLRLTKKEADLLASLMQALGTPLSRERLLMKVWGTDTEVELGNVDNYISFLRRRLAVLDCKAAIKTVYGAGYLLES